MSTFLFLAGVCVVGGFLTTSIVWVIFWITGVFEIPDPVRQALGLRGQSAAPRLKPPSDRVPQLIPYFTNMRPIRFVISVAPNEVAGTLLNPGCDARQRNSPGRTSYVLKTTAALDPQREELLTEAPSNQLYAAKA